SPALVEIGGGTGALSGHMLRRLRETVPELYRDMRLVLIETSPYHRQLQEEALRGAEVEKRWYSSLREAAAAEGVEG
ncbi:SAM-dependent methyltransferase, partial [Anoxybacillus sp. LAT_38]|nr:SAM-dependent methyltransferase [Anoxybacillus sp. LAT_38]